MPSLARSARTERRFHFRSLLFALAPVLVAVALGSTAMHRWQAHQRSQDAVYAQAEASLLASDYDAAELGFGALGSYRDADERLVEVHAAADPVRQALETVVATIAGGDYATAIAQLESIVQQAPGYRPATDLLVSSRVAWIEQLDRDVSAAIANRDWLGAELALRALSKLLPDDVAVATQLDDLVRQHAPVVFARDGAVFIDGPQGSQEDALTAPMGAIFPSWSPDRTQIAFIATTEGEDRVRGKLMLMNGDGSNLRSVAVDVLPYSWPVWSPDGGRIAFTSIHAFDTDSFTGAISLDVYDLVDETEIDLTGDQLPHAAMPTWSPDGSEIAFVSNTIQRRTGGGIELRDGDVYSVPSSGGLVVDLTQNRILNESWVQWSPAGDRLLIFTTPGDWSNPAKSRLFLLTVVRDELVEIPIDEWQTSLPFWSPDGMAIAYVTAGDTVNIWSDEGLRWVQLGADVSSFVTWSPDGRYLLAPPVDDAHPGFVVNVVEGFGTVAPVQIDFDSMSSGNAPPIWGSITPLHELAETNRPT